MDINKIKITKKIIKSPKKVNSLSNELKKFKKESPPKINPSSNSDKIKKIKIPVKTKKKPNLMGYIPTNLSETLTDTLSTKPLDNVNATLVKSENKALTGPVVNKLSPKPVENKAKPKSLKKHSVKKTKKIHRKKSTKNKTISVKLDNENKEKDILSIIDKFEKMDVKDIKDFLEKKGISSKNNDKSKLLPYLYILTCVDDDLNIIKN